MPRRIVILVDDSDRLTRNRITEALRDSSAAWWHWFQDAWLVVDPEDRSLSFWRDLVLGLSPGGTRILVLPVDPTGGWSAVAPEEARAWLHGTWKRAKSE
jgi:hypothetical protein